MENAFIKNANMSSLLNKKSSSLEDGKLKRLQNELEELKSMITKLITTEGIISFFLISNFFKIYIIFFPKDKKPPISPSNLLK